MHAEKPGVCLSARESGAVYSRLLACANAYRLSVVRVADGIRLCIFESDQCHDQIAHGLFRELLLLGNDVREKLTVDLKEVVSLLKCDSEDLLSLLFRRQIISEVPALRQCIPVR